MTQRFAAAIHGCDGPRLTSQEARFFSQSQPFGFILFDRNIETSDQIRALCAELRSAVGRDAPVFIDQEGGRVQRIRPPLAREWLPPLDHVSALRKNAVDGMFLRYQIIGAELRALGIDGNCAPTLDIARPQTHPVLRNRCYGDTVEQVVSIGRSVAQGLMSAGVYPVIKHMPGHGLAQMDSHKDLPRITADAATLTSQDFAVFRAFSDLPFGMTAHLVFEAMSDLPTTIDPRMIALIRDLIGFDGLLMTDDISMQALSGTVPERGAAALLAGCDVVLHCNGDLDERKALYNATGPMSDASQSRAERALKARPDPTDIDIPALAAKLAEMENTSDT